jgi:hypothetical protein
MYKNFDIKNHFWIVAGDLSQVYSSAAKDFVVADDAGFKEWKESSGLPTPIDSLESLKEVFDSQYPDGWKKSLSELKQAKTEVITAAFTNALADGFVTTSGIKMDADITDVQLLKSAYDLMILLNQTTLPILVDYNNTAHDDMPLTDVIAIIIEVAVNYQTLYAKKQALRGQAMAANTEAELDLIAW